jgi:hypothetical protein
LLGIVGTKPKSPKSSKSSFIDSEPKQAEKPKVLKEDFDRLKHLEALGISVACQPKSPTVK